MKHVRRSYWSYLHYIVFVLLAFNNAFKFEVGWKYYWIFIGLSFLVILVRLLFKPYYLRIKDNRLIVTRDLFYEEYVELDDIDKIELEESPFLSSYIRLKNNKKPIKFNYFIISDKDFRSFKEYLQLNVKVIIE